MPLWGPEVDIRNPPAGFDELIEWLEKWSYRLVLLEEYSIADLRAALRRVQQGVRAHGKEADPRPYAPFGADEEAERLVMVVRSDHEWFERSVEQFDWFLQVVEREDHGGHRQALGQFGRVFAEALRRHRRDERRLEAMEAGRDTPPSS